MKQVVQNFGSGVLELLDVPCPAAGRGQLLIQTRASLISAGTERALVEFGRAGLLSKARQSPERVKQVWDKIRAEGLMPTMEAVFAKLDEPMPLGYSNAGVVVEVGPGVTQFAAGDRVASNGGHAEMVSRPVNLCAKIPAGVSDEAASFAVLGSIGLQGIRLLRPELGETVAVFGLGLIGLLTVQMLAGSGARVLGIDPDPGRREMAGAFGAIPIDTAGDVVAAALAQTASRGVDGVLVTASARDDEILSQAARMSRKRGRIVLVGVVNMELNRAEFYEKELSFQVSCSYGPGRYDAQYEDQGVDYPFAFVRWTEQRNIEAVLGLMESGRLDVSPLITKHIPHAQAAAAYELLSSDRGQLGIVLDYPAEPPATERVVHTVATAIPTTGTSQVTVGVIGAGSFTKRVVLPALAKTTARLAVIASAGGVTAAHAAQVRLRGEHDRLSHDPGRQGHQLRIHHGAAQPARVDGCRSPGRRQTRVRGKAAGDHARRVAPRARGLRRQPRLATDGRLQPAFLTTCRQDTSIAFDALTAGRIQHAGQRRRDSAQPLDARPAGRRRPDHWRGMPLDRPVELPGCFACNRGSGRDDGWRWGARPPTTT